VPPLWSTETPWGDLAEELLGPAPAKRALPGPSPDNQAGALPGPNPAVLPGPTPAVLPGRRPELAPAARSSCVSSPGGQLMGLSSAPSVGRSHSLTPSIVTDVMVLAPDLAGGLVGVGEHLVFGQTQALAEVLVALPRHVTGVHVV